MELNEFIAHFAEQFEDTPVETFKADTQFRSLEEWSSLMALNIIAMIDEEYEVTIKGAEMRAADTIEELYNIVKNK